MAMLIVFAGLPGTGKSTIARAAALRLAAVYLRIDTIEQAIRAAGVPDPGSAGYVAATHLAAENLRLGRTVIADSVNPLKITRDAYRDVAERCGVQCLDVEVICSDTPLHRHRVETRRSTVDGLLLPTWEQVEQRRYDAWDRPRLQLDTARLSVEESVARILAAATP